MTAESEDKATHTFHERFNIELSIEEAQTYFRSRVLNDVDSAFPHLMSKVIHYRKSQVLRHVAYILGKQFSENDCFSEYVGVDYRDFICSIEALYLSLGRFGGPMEEAILATIVKDAIEWNDIDIGIKWENGIFHRSGAKLLDNILVNENLNWLSDPKYADVLAPFEKGLRAYLEANKLPERLVDTIRDMYVALEKMARIICRNNRNLKANAEQFVSTLDLSTYYARMLKDHTEYAHEFRHAVEEGTKIALPAPQEVEAFVYTTGIFIRLSIQQLNQASESE